MLTLFLCVLVSASPADFDSGGAKLSSEFNKTVQPFLKTYCYKCHAKDKPKGDFDIRPLAKFDSIAGAEQLWKMAMDQIETEQMPPEEAKLHPETDARKKILLWLKDARRYEAKRLAGDPGIVPASRLSNAEYDNTIRDLTGADIKPASEFPVDPANQAGFDNSGESLTMSPSLAKKYLEASKKVSEHLIFKPDGVDFAPFPVIAETDRDKYGVRRIIDFYKTQSTNYVDYFYSAWRQERGQTISVHKISSKYLQTITSALTSTNETVGPLAVLQKLWSNLPTDLSKTNEALRGCEKLSAFVGAVRQKLNIPVRTLHAPGMNDGSQTLVLWKDREMAANRRVYKGGVEINPEEAGLEPGSAAAELLKVPPDRKEALEKSFERFCSIFPDGFYVSERARIFLDGKEDASNTGRFLSAGFHNQMGYFRDDQPLYDLILDDAGQKKLDSLWRDFEFSSELPFRMHAGFIWFERAESSFLRDPEFDFARAEDKDIVSESKFKKLVEVYTTKARRLTTNQVVLKAVQDHFKISEANIRWLEKTRAEAEPKHLAALQKFAERAYRRPLSDSERGEIIEFYKTCRNTNGLGHDEAVRDTLMSILMSPYCCYRLDLPSAAQGSKPGSVQPLSDFSLASRLSYFLWASMPDDELMKHARAGDLHNPEVLRAQTKRLLQDPRARGFATEFAGNWLDFRRFEEHNAVDRDRFPSFNNELRSAMFEEPLRFFLDVAQKDRSILDFIYANRAFVNAPLARHYGMPVPANMNDWVEINDADKFGRGGLLSMAVFQTRNSPGLRTSPVKRGYWVARRILGEVIPPPPPQVPELPSDESKLGEMTLRDALVKHRQDKTCAACHARFDSFGLVFENFGPVGELRSKDLAGHPVDTKAIFPDGAEGEGVQGLRAYIKTKRQEDFVENLSRKLLAYALNRSLQLSDEPLIEEMREKLKANDYRFSSLIDTIVMSPQFLNKRSPVQFSDN